MLGPEHLGTRISLNNLAMLLKDQGDLAGARPLSERALAIREGALGPGHPDLVLTLDALASLFASSGNNEKALAYSRQATASVIAHAVTEVSGAHHTEGAANIIEQRTNYFVRHVANLSSAAKTQLEAGEQLGRDALIVAQWATHSSAAAAVQQTSLRFAAGSDALAMLVRERQDLSALWRERNKVFLEAISKPEGQRNQVLIDNIRNQIAETERKLAAKKAQLEREFPDYAALANPKPLNPEEVQHLLSADEALIFWLAGEKHRETYVFALTRDGFEWKTIPLKSEALAQKVAAFRRGLDVDALHRGLERRECTQAEADKRGLSRIECAQALAKECEEAEKRGLTRTDCATGQGRRELFDLGVAHELYEAVIGPVEPLIKNKRHLIVVPSGALTALPFHLLVTEKPAPAAPGDLAAYRNAQWLLRRHAVSVLPSVASLGLCCVFCPLGLTNNLLGRATADTALRLARSTLSSNSSSSSSASFCQRED